MATFIDGIAASENIDSSGERIIIAGLDCSSLEKDGVFNYEHKNDQPNQVVGKVLKAKKIFSDKDCEDDRQLYFWQKCQVPYLYVMGELFDDYKDSARDIAGMFRYDHDKRGQNERNVMNFSVEGAKIEKKGMDIVKSIARKVTITVLPCNKAAIAEMVPAPAKKPKDDLDNIFKTEVGVEIELFKQPTNFAEILKREPQDLEKGSIGWSKMPKKKSLGERIEQAAYRADDAVFDVANRAAHAVESAAGKIGDKVKSAASKVKQAMTLKKAAGDTANPKGSLLGTTKSGKQVWSHGRVGDYHGFNSADHKEAAELHQAAGRKSKDTKLSWHHDGKTKLHMQASGNALDRETKAAKTSIKTSPKPSTQHKFIDIPGKGRGVIKSELQKGHPTTERAHSEKNWPQSPKQSRRPRGQFDGSVGVHDEYDQRGMAIHNPGHGFTGESKKEIHAHHKDASRKKLAELKAMPKPNLPKSEAMSKALTAGSSNVAPSQREGMAALAKEDVKGVHSQETAHHFFDEKGKFDRGVSVAGAKARSPKSYDDVDTARKIHSQKLNELKSMPKPKLTKAEDDSERYTKEYGHLSAPQLRPGERYHLASHSPHTGALHYKGEVSSKKSLRSTVDRRDNKHGAYMRHKVKILPPKTGVQKSEMLMRAEEAYTNWEKREEFRDYMKKRLPNLAMGEIDAIGQVMALRKALEAEAALVKMSGLAKAEKKGRLVGSAPSKEHLNQLVDKYFYSKTNFKDNNDGTHSVHHDSGKKIEGFRVREHKGRWRFEME